MDNRSLKVINELTCKIRYNGPIKKFFYDSGFSKINNMDCEDYKKAYFKRMIKKRLKSCII